MPSATRTTAGISGASTLEADRKLLASQLAEDDRHGYRRADYKAPARRVRQRGTAA
jgi:hypothetical protein